MAHYSYPKEKIKILLLENIHEEARRTFSSAGYSADILPTAISPEELKQIIADIHILGIRSRTTVSAEVLQRAKRLLAIGCFCIGTDQTDLKAASLKGVPVFNSPFANTRSVAELTMAEIVLLARKAGDLNIKMHSGRWEKTAKDCHEVRYRKLGIIGYGHIGQQVGILAEAFGMQVSYFDIEKKLPLGNAKPLPSLDELLKMVDFVTLHVPDTELTRGMIGERELSLMRKGSYLLNLSRGLVVDLKALKEALQSGHLAGAALDVYPCEPEGKEAPFESELRGLPNLFLTPHIGGSTEEAQKNIGRETAQALINFLDTGSSVGAVNFPSVTLPVLEGAHRVLHIHKNVPGVLSEVNKIMAEIGANIHAQYLATNPDIGYLIMDIDKSLSKEVKASIDAMPTTIRTRLLF